MKGKVRLDQLLVKRGLSRSREGAKRLILAGQVLANGAVLTKAGSQMDDGVELQIRGEDAPYVSRGGIKLQAALEHFQVEVRDRLALDIGASTGGFTDCLLQHGARRVIAVDVGYGQLAWRLRQDPRVVVLERRNIRLLRPEEVGEPVDLATIDVSFISLTLVLPVVRPLLVPQGEVIALIKPQFEVGRGEVGKGGVVRQPQQHEAVIRRLTDCATGLGLAPQGVIPSPLLGPKGNREFLLHLRHGGTAPLSA